MDFQAKLAGLAKRLPVTGELEVLVRGIGEAKSKQEEDAIVQRMIEICKQQIRDGLPRKGENTKPLKDILVYLIYINMLGHETNWASAAVIQLCSHKSLAVKKAAYLATSLLIDPTSELTIMVTATIQADLKSDNFLVVCTALQAISHCAGPELVTVFLPQVLALLRHDRDAVKKKALLALHRLLQLDPGIAPDVERQLIDKLGHKEPSVMFATLAGLHELAKRDPAPYRNLVHYFTNILKQASEGKLGRTWDYHRAPAPFVQIELLRLLALLGAGDKDATSNMTAIILDVWRRADALASTAGNALVYECMRTATAIYPNDTLLSMVVQTVPRFLASKENNLRFAGIDVLSRIVDGDAGRVEQFQLAIVDCLRSPDVTLKRKTLDLLFKMAGPGNMDVIAQEVLSYLKSSGDDDAPRQEAAQQLLAVAEQLAPSLAWFADTITALLEEAGDVAPAAAADALIRVVAEGSSGGDPSGDEALRRRVALRCYALADKPKLPSALLRVVCWTLGQYGLATGKPFDAVVERVAGIPETQVTNDEVLAGVAVALGKLALRSGQPLPEEAQAVLRTLVTSGSLEVQQAAAEVLALIKAAPAIQRAALPPTGAEASTAIDAALPFLDAYVHAAEQAGAAPHLDLQDRVAMGVTRAPDTHFPSAMPYHGSLKFQAYEVAQMPVALPAAAPAAAAAPSADFFDGLDLGGLSVSSSVAAQPAVQQPPALHPTPPTQAPVEQLRVSKQGRRWGPGAVPHPTPATPPSPSGGQALAPLSGSSAGASTYVDGGYKRAQPAPAPAASAHIDPEQQRLAASLFGGGGGAAARSAGVKKNAGSSAGHAARAPEIDLLGEAFGSEQVTAGNGSGAGVAGGGADNGGLLGADFMGLQVPASASDAGAQGSDPLAALSELNMPAFGGGGFATEQGHGGFGLLSAPQSRAPAPAPAVQQQPAKQQDPFASLLD